MFEKGVLKILKQDHKLFQRLLKTLSKTNDRSEQQRVLRELAMELMVHAKVEEELFYPALERAKEQGKVKSVERAYEEHHLAETALQDLLKEPVGSTGFEAKQQVLRGLVIMHAKEEEMGLFSMAKMAMDRNELEALGTRVEQRKVSLRTEVGRQLQQVTA